MVSVPAFPRRSDQRLLRSLRVKTRIAMIAAVGVLGVVALGVTNHLNRGVQERAQAEVSAIVQTQGQVGLLLRVVPDAQARFFDMLRKGHGDRGDRLEEAMTALGAQVTTLRGHPAASGESASIDQLDKAVVELRDRLKGVTAARTELGLAAGEGLAGRLAMHTMALEAGLQEQISQGFTPALQRVSNLLQTLLKLQARYMSDLDEPTEADVLIAFTRMSNELKKLDLPGDGNDVLLQRLAGQEAAFEAWKTGAKALVTATEAADRTFSKVAEPLGDLRAALDTRATALRQDVVQRMERAAVFDQLAVGAIAVICAFLAWLVSTSITGPLGRLREAMTRLSAGDTAVSIDEARHRDEIGEMARTLEVFRDNAIERADLMAREVAEAKARGDRARGNDEAVAEFGQTVSGVMSTLDGAALRLAEASGALGDVARAAAARTETARTAAGDMAMRIGMVAGATDELSSSIAEVTTSTRQSAESAEAALNEVEATRKRMALLNQTAERIGEVVSLIQAIASQTNLLALNATIEAARAGEAGRGFAVVAQEVKALAAQTQSATEEIARQVNAIQGETHGVSQAVDGMAGAVDRLRSVALHVATAINQQESTITEIASAMSDISRGAEASASAADGAGQAAAQASQVSAQINEISAALNGSARALADNVHGFIARVRAA
jgi:methyl-accepting chemotaxis protein